MRVPVVSRTRLEDIRRTRVLIEGTVTAWAVEHITGEMLETLRGLAAQIGQSLANPTSVRDGLEHNQLFHFTIYRAAQSPSMMAMIESLWLQSGRSEEHTSELQSLMRISYAVFCLKKKKTKKSKITTAETSKT